MKRASTLPLKGGLENYVMICKFEFPNMPVCVNVFAEVCIGGKVLDIVTKGAVCKSFQFKNRRQISHVTVNCSVNWLTILYDYANNLTLNSNIGEERKCVLPNAFTNQKQRLMKAINNS